MDSLDLASLFLIALGLAADCFAVAICTSVSLRTISPIQILRVSLAFGLFQGIMPVLGWLAGKTFVDIIAPYDHWVAFFLLAGIGGKMIWESFRECAEDEKKADNTRGWLLVTLSFATSIDALAVGLSFAFLEVNILHMKSVLLYSFKSYFIAPFGCFYLLVFKT